MGEDQCLRGNGVDLLKQLELILERDSLIDEVGFLHPSQFVTLNTDPESSSLSNPSIEQSADDFLNKDILEFTEVPYDKAVFWNSNHKLAISTQVLPQLYNAARNAYMDAGYSYKKLLNSSNATEEEKFVHFYESEILKHSRVLLLISCDFRSAWNSRKLVLSGKPASSFLMDEFQLSKLILSYSPKSECAWNHRRWVIRMIAERYPNLQEVIEKESDLVKEIAETFEINASFASWRPPQPDIGRYTHTPRGSHAAKTKLLLVLEKSRMNYRAWNHRCWLVPYMLIAQVLDELYKSRKWAELHVADNCCLHYRRQLMLRMLDDSFVKQDGEKSFKGKSDIYFVWKEELEWNELLIKHYVGREALWVHRRFLSQCWIKHFSHNQQVIAFNQHHASPSLDVILGEELQILHTCLNTSADEFQDTQIQAQHAACYIFWIAKQIPPPMESELQEKLKKVGNLKAILIEACPEKTIIWDSLLH